MKGQPRVAIVGRPNVGKSTLFNRLTGSRRAIVHSDPGVTRDVQRAEAEWNGVVFELIDTGGLFSGIDDELIEAVEARALKEATSADLMVFVTDGEAGMTSADADVAESIRAAEVPVVVAVNKTEKNINEHAAGEFYKLGHDEIYPISALHGQGVGDLLDAIVRHLPEKSIRESEKELRLALIGRPNVGKSSLINALVGDDTNIVDSRPGTTRDSVDLSIRWHGHDVTLVDTAGIQRRSRTKDGLTAITALKSIETISRADVVVLVIDADRKIANQDVKVASYAHKAGKGILVCVNKWDLVEDKDSKTSRQFEKDVRRAFAFVSYAPIIFTSAKTHQRVHRIMEEVWKIKEAREERAQTSELNDFLAALVASNPPPFHAGGNGKIYYATQVDIGPPTINFYVNKRAYFNRTYLRFLNNRIRDKWGFRGSVIRIKLLERERQAEEA